MEFPIPGDESLSFMKELVKNDFDFFLERCRIYGEFLYSTNDSMNLTAIPAEYFWSKHVADALSILRFFPRLQENRVRLCDLGCGGGIPSLILAAALPGLLVTAVDSRGKKIDFVSTAATKMKLENLRGVHGRGNELGHKPDYKHRFDFVTARAVSDAKTLIRETSMLMNRTGELIIYRTPTQAKNEIVELDNMKPRPAFHLTPTLELPESAGTRLFLSIAARKSN